MTPATLPLAVLRRAKVLHVSAISQAISATACDAVFAAIDAVRAAGGRVSYDPNLRLKLWPLPRARAVIVATMAHCDWFLPSLDEARTLSGIDAPDAIIDWCHAQGAPVVALKCGADGVRVSAGGRRLDVAAHRVASVDATGAGDCFDGAFVARVVAGDDPFAAARLRQRGGGAGDDRLRRGRAAAARSRRARAARDPDLGRGRRMIESTFGPDVFAGQVALVVGGTSGIGAAIADALAGCGAVVTVTGATRGRGRRGGGAAGFRCRDAVALDVRDDAAIRRLVGDLPRLDVLVNCAGVIRRDEEHDPAVFAEVLAINLTGTMRCCAAAQPKLAQRGGAIVNIASMLSFFGGARVPATARARAASRSSPSRWRSRMPTTASASTRSRRAGCARR